MLRLLSRQGLKEQADEPVFPCTLVERLVSDYRRVEEITSEARQATELCMEFDKEDIINLFDSTARDGWNEGFARIEGKDNTLLASELIPRASGLGKLSLQATRMLTDRDLLRNVITTQADSKGLANHEGVFRLLRASGEPAEHAIMASLDKEIFSALQQAVRDHGNVRNPNGLVEYMLKLSTNSELVKQAMRIGLDKVALLKTLEMVSDGSTFIDGVLDIASSPEIRKMFVDITEAGQVDETLKLLSVAEQTTDDKNGDWRQYMRSANFGKAVLTSPDEEPEPNTYQQPKWQ